MFPLPVTAAALLTVFHLMGADSLNLSCPENINVIADKNSAAATVSWYRTDFQLSSNHPIKGLYQIWPIYGASATVRRTFSEGENLIEYKAVDSAGHNDTCSFTVTVTVVRCPVLYNPQFGVLTCDHTNLYGSRCTVSCIHGYTVTGDDIECTEDGIWSDDLPFCRTTVCSDPGTPLHGSRSCTTVTHSYGSVCSFNCSTGYSRLGSARIVCQSVEDETLWSDPTPYCQEIIPPRVEICPTSVIQVSTGLTLVEVHKPRVLFRTVSGEEAPHHCSHFEQHASQNFTIGLHAITCTSYDPAFGVNELSICEFSIRVKANVCRPLSQPQNGFLLCSRVHRSLHVYRVTGAEERDDDNGSVSTSLEHTSICRLFCYRGYTYSRRDNDEMRTEIFTCDHSTGQWLPTAFVPSCVIPSRPHELKLPAELLYHSSNCQNANSLVEMRTKFQTVLLTIIRLHDACSMNPRECIVDDVTTNCLVERTTRSHRTSDVTRRTRRSRQYSPAADSRQRLRHDSYTVIDKSFANEMTTRDHLTRSRSKTSTSSNVLLSSHMIRLNSTVDGDISPTVTSTSSDVAMSNVTGRFRTSRRQVTVTPRTGRQFFLPVQFHFATRLASAGGEWPDEYHRASHRLFRLFRFFDKQIKSGLFNLTSKVRSLRVQEVQGSLIHSPLKTICDLGYEFDVDILLCVPCGAGSYFDNAQDRCVQCPDGLKQPHQGQFSCY